MEGKMSEKNGATPKSQTTHFPHFPGVLRSAVLFLVALTKSDRRNKVDMHLAQLITILCNAYANSMPIFGRETGASIRKAVPLSEPVATQIPICSPQHFQIGTSILRKSLLILESLYYYRYSRCRKSSEVDLPGTRQRHTRQPRLLRNVAFPQNSWAGSLFSPGTLELAVRGPDDPELCEPLPTTRTA